MGYPLQWLRSLLFNINVYLSMAVLAVYFTPPAIFNRDWAFRGVRTYCRYVRWSARWMIGLRSEVRGPVPQEELLIAAKHQSFFDIIILCSVLPRPKFIMKSQLKWAPILGWYALRMGCVPVDRGKRGKAVAKMKADVASGLSLPGQLIIYPQGTRVAPGAPRPYKIGTALLYEQLDQPCLPVAVNVGLFWPRQAVYRKPGLAVVEFLPVIAPGMAQEAFMGALEARIEAGSNALMAEAGFDAAKRTTKPM
jgi:1-acyl-sn-glycerol-3-phosphate acyltransferase